jgi:hypothetical protein
MRHNKKPIKVINAETKEVISFESQFDFARRINVNRATISKWDKRKLLKGVWIYKEIETASLSKHKHFLIANGKGKQCRKCQIILSLEVQLCPICNTRQ